MESRRGFMQLVFGLATVPFIPTQKRSERMPVDCDFSLFGFEDAYAIYFKKFSEHPEILNVSTVDIVAAKMVLREANCENIKIVISKAVPMLAWSLEGKHGIVYSRGV